MNRKCYLAAVILFASSEAHASTNHEVQLHNSQGVTVASINYEECDDTSPAEYNVATCSQPTVGGVFGDGFVTVGGGAVVDGDVSPGAMLVSSYLSTSDRRTWIAVSKDHEYFYPHRLKAYSIGLRLSGISTATLGSNNNVQLFNAPLSATSEFPSAHMNVGSGYTLIGGGVRTTYNGNGLLLWESRPWNGGWRASAKDHFDFDTGTVQVWAIGIKSSFLNNLGLSTVETPSDSTTRDCTSGGFDSKQVDFQAFDPSNSFVVGSAILGAGGRAQYNGVGRLLTGVAPFGTNDGWNHLWVQSVDHHSADSGCTYATAILLQSS